MKTIYLFLSACCCLVLGACTAPEPTTQNNGIMGKWRLVEELGDPGDGSGTFQPVAKGAERILVFERGGSFREIRGAFIRRPTSTIPMNSSRIIR